MVLYQPLRKAETDEIVYEHRSGIIEGKYVPDFKGKEWMNEKIPYKSPFRRDSPLGEFCYVGNEETMERLGVERPGGYSYNRLHRGDIGIGYYMTEDLESILQDPKVLYINQISFDERSERVGDLGKYEDCVRIMKMGVEEIISRLLLDRSADLTDFGLDKEYIIALTKGIYQDNLKMKYLQETIKNRLLSSNKFNQYANGNERIKGGSTVELKASYIAKGVESTRVINQLKYKVNGVSRWRVRSALGKNVVVSGSVKMSEINNYNDKVIITAKALWKEKDVILSILDDKDYVLKSQNGVYAIRAKENKLGWTLELKCNGQSKSTRCMSMDAARKLREAVERW